METTAKKGILMPLFFGSIRSFPFLPRNGCKMNYLFLVATAQLLFCANIENIDKTDFKNEAALRYIDFDKAKKLAAMTGKTVMVEIMSASCRYCIKMQNTTFKDRNLLAFLRSRFVSVRIDVNRQKVPEKIVWSVTPTFVFIDSEGKFLKSVPGAWKKEDFFSILKKVAEMKGDYR